MLALKLTFALAGLLAVIRYVPVYYHASQFDDFVQQEVQRTLPIRQLKREILDKAGVYSLPVEEGDIKIITTGSVFRVEVDYRVPVDFHLFQHELAFQTGASIWFRDSADVR